MMHERLRAARKYKGFTQQQLADAIGVKQQSYQKCEVSPEKGGTKMPENLKEIADVCGVNLHWLLTGEGLMVTNASPIDKEIAESLTQLSTRQKDKISRIIKEFIQENKEVVSEIGGVFSRKNYAVNNDSNTYARA